VFVSRHNREAKKTLGQTIRHMDRMEEVRDPAPRRPSTRTARTRAQLAFAQDGAEQDQINTAGHYTLRTIARMAKQLLRPQPAPEAGVGFALLDSPPASPLGDFLDEQDGQEFPAAAEAMTRTLARIAAAAVAELARTTGRKPTAIVDELAAQVLTEQPER
jgi:hypothetical protein